MTAHVIVKFEGLMVFHRCRSTNLYEVGILQNATGHKLSISYAQSGESNTTIPDWRIAQLKGVNKHWELDLIDTETSTPRREPHIPTGSHQNRHDLMPDGRQFDFSWIIDLESEEFHGPIMHPININALNPILHLGNGTLSTHSKTVRLDRRRGAKSYERFGFIAETIALCLEFREGEKVVLKVKDSDEEVFHLEHSPGATYRVNIVNSSGPAHPGDPDHFQLYYEHLFPNIVERFGLRLHTPRTEDDYPPNPCLAPGLTCIPATEEPEMKVSHEHNGEKHTGEENHHHVIVESTVAGINLTVNPFRCGGVALGNRQNDLP